MSTPAADKRRPLQRAADSVERAYEAIRKLATEYKFRPGEKLNEVELARDMGLSRTPIREALQRLEREGFLTFVPNKGFFAEEVTPNSVRDLYEVRASLERTAFRMACERASMAEIQAACALWEERPMASSLTAWDLIAQADEAFHEAIARASGNARLVRLLEVINARVRFFRRIDLEQPERLERSFAEHAAIIECFRRRDAKKGGDLLEEHVAISAAAAIIMTKEGLARMFFASRA